MVFALTVSSVHGERVDLLVERRGPDGKEVLSLADTQAKRLHLNRNLRKLRRDAVNDASVKSQYLYRPTKKPLEDLAAPAAQFRLWKLECSDGGARC